MNRTEQKKNEEMPAISPLTKDKTYGEQWYSRVVDNLLNYWTNLLASAGFSHWVEHANKPLKILGNKSPQELQQKLAAGIRDFKPDFMMQRFIQSMEAEGTAGIKTQAQVAEAILDRSMARARSLTLLMPGFLIMIPAVWLGAKIKPWFVEKLNAYHYGQDAMEDPSLKARHQAIEAEERPTLLGTIIARIGTVGAVQIAAQSLGSKNNALNKFGQKHNNQTLSEFAIDPITEKIGSTLGAATPENFQARFNQKTRDWGYDWSQAQRKEAAINKLPIHGEYTNAAQDLGRFIAADTIYTLISAGTIRPLLNLLRHIPFMTYKPKVAANSATFDGDTVKVPKNTLADASIENTAHTDIRINEASVAANDAHYDKQQPSPKVTNVQRRMKLAENPEQRIA